MKKMNPMTIAFLLFLYLPCTIIAQKNFVNGYIVTIEKDTIFGLVHLTPNSYVNKKIEFKRNNSNVSETLNPNEIKCIRTEEKYIESKNVFFGNEKKQMFLEVIFEGLVNAYYLDDNNFFVEKDDSIYQLSLIEKEILKEEDGKKYFVESKEYLGILAFLFKDEPKMVQEIGNNRLTKKSLAKIFREYSDKTCKDCDFTDYTDTKKHSVFIEPQIGINHAILGFVKPGDFVSFTAPSAAINIHVPSLRNKHWDLITGISYSFYKFSGDYNHSIYTNKETYRVSLDYSTLTIPLMIEYSFTRNKIQPTIKIGYNNNFILSQNNSLYDVIKIDTGHEIISVSKESTMRNYQFGLMAGCGTKIKISNKSFFLVNFNFEFRAPSTNTHYFLDKQKTSSIQLNVGYSYKIR